jgi:hypothetical protein
MPEEFKFNGFYFESDKVDRGLGGLYFVSKPNPFLRLGTLVRRLDDGYERVITETVDHRLQIVGYAGLVYPHETLGPFVSFIQRSGVDAGSSRMDRRRAHGD